MKRGKNQTTYAFGIYVCTKRVFRQEGSSFLKEGSSFLKEGSSFLKEDSSFLKEDSSFLEKRHFTPEKRHFTTNQDFTPAFYYNQIIVATV